MSAGKRLATAVQPTGSPVERLRSHAKATLPMLHELPIPADVRPGKGWTHQMHEMAAHIGPHATLTIVAAFGGEQVYISPNPARSPFRDVIDEATVAVVASVYGGNKLQIPVARHAVDTARRAVVIAAVRAKRLTGADARRIIGTSRTYVSHLVNATNEGKTLVLDAAVERLEPRQRDLFALPPPK